MQSTTRELDQFVKTIMRIHAGRHRTELLRMISNAYHEELLATGVRPRVAGQMVSLRRIADILGVDSGVRGSINNAAKRQAEATRRVALGGCTPNQKAQRWVVTSPATKIVMR